jgi:hypothetical protein
MKATPVLGITLLLLLGSAACSSSTTTSTSVPTSTSTPTSTVAAVATTTAGTTATTTAGRTAVATVAAPAATPTTSAGLGRCLWLALNASLGQSQGTAGTFHIALLLTNRAHLTCALDGYPGVSFIGGTNAHQIGAPAQRDDRFSAAPVVLAPGATVEVTVEVADYGNYDKKACQPAKATGYRIFPPGSTGSLFISAPQTVCSKPDVQGFQTSVVRTGSLPD